MEAINLNSMVKVIPNEIGIKIIEEAHQDIKPFLKDKELLKPDGSFETTLWHLMDVFGKEMFMGNDMPFVDGKIYLVEDVEDITFNIIFE